MRVYDGVAGDRPGMDTGFMSSAVGVINFPHVAAQMLLQNEHMMPPDRCHAWGGCSSREAEPVAASQSDRMAWPNIRTAAPQPQKARDAQPYGCDTTPALAVEQNPSNAATIISTFI